MSQILYVVMAISLASLLTFGGISYFNSDTSTRLIVSRGLISQYEAITSGISSYRLANNGLLPESIDQFKGYMHQGEVPSFGEKSDIYSWTVGTLSGNSIACVSIPSDKSLAVSSALAFAQDAKSKKANPIVGESCGSGDEYVKGMTIPTTPTIFITLKGA